MIRSRRSLRPTISKRKLRSQSDVDHVVKFHVGPDSGAPAAPEDPTLTTRAPVQIGTVCSGG